MNTIFKRVALPIGAAVVLGSSGFAFMANNAVPVTRAGDGTSAISGYQVSNVGYSVDSNELIFSVGFTLDGPSNPPNVRAYVKNSNGQVIGNYINCGLQGSSTTRYECAPNGLRATVADAESLRVVATQ